MAPILLGGPTDLAKVVASALQLVQSGTVSSLLACMAKVPASVGACVVVEDFVVSEFSVASMLCPGLPALCTGLLALLWVCSAG